MPPCVENIEYHPERRLNREQILRLASCTYLQEAHNVIILGATGAGKTYLACALGMAASRSFYSVRYIRLPDLLVEISVARANGTYRDYMKKRRKEKLLILDEWLLYPLKEAEARDVLELVEARNKVASTIFCSQYDTSEWHENLYDPTLADAICDRITLAALNNRDFVVWTGHFVSLLSVIDGWGGALPPHFGQKNRRPFFRFPARCAAV